ncbi:MAG: hypothetical protein H7336_09870 [Bacteriovorax sp.]|nr:hypothetical protein [Bacteriovorax sp.]
MIKIAIETNYNNKMECDVIFHLAMPPKKMPTNEQLEAISFEMFTSDGSHPPINVKCKEIQLLNLWKVPEALTMISHKMNDTQFISHLFNREPELQDLGNTAQVALYVYAKAFL